MWSLIYVAGLTSRDDLMFGSYGFLISPIDLGPVLSRVQPTPLQSGRSLVLRLNRSVLELCTRKVFAIQKAKSFVDFPFQVPESGWLLSQVGGPKGLVV